MIQSCGTAALEKEKLRQELSVLLREGACTDEDCEGTAGEYSVFFTWNTLWERNGLYD
jgi:hypothetical protein